MTRHTQVTLIYTRELGACAALVRNLNIGKISLSGFAWSIRKLHPPKCSAIRYVCITYIHVSNHAIIRVFVMFRSICWRIVILEREGDLPYHSFWRKILMALTEETCISTWQCRYCGYMDIAQLVKHQTTQFCGFKSHLRQLIFFENDCVGSCVV